ncbi:hypothetical protein [Citrobacter pasteurii]|nr:hypothetical protein [Citrobacter pasteurii]
MGALLLIDEALVRANLTGLCRGKNKTVLIQPATAGFLFLLLTEI